MKLKVTFRRHLREGSAVLDRQLRSFVLHGKEPAVSRTSTLNLEVLKSAVAGDTCAFRCRCELQPAGGSGDKVFPPTYEGGQYATETRRIDGQEVPCVLLDSVQSQANRIEEALLAAWERKQITLPVIVVDFGAKGLPEVGRITSLDAPHRVADAILRDSLIGGKRFRQSARGKQLDEVSLQNATPLFELCPTALLFGMWDSTGPKGGMGAKFARTVVSEIVGVNAVIGKRTSSRIDPLPIVLQAGPVYKSRESGWTLDPGKAEKDKKGNPVKVGKDGRPSEVNLGNITPTIQDGGVTIDKAVLTTVMSLPGLRRLRFPVDGESKVAVDDAARTVLAALGLCGIALTLEKGLDLRSRCLLVQAQPMAWEMVNASGEVAALGLTAADAVRVLNEAVKEAMAAGLPWPKEGGKPILTLEPSDDLVGLVKKSYEIAASGQMEGEE